MKQVFIVTKESDSGYRQIAGVYDSEDKAKNVCEHRNEMNFTWTYDYDSYEVE